MKSSFSDIFGVYFLGGAGDILYLKISLVARVSQNYVLGLQREAKSSKGFSSALGRDDRLHGKQNDIFIELLMRHGKREHFDSRRVRFLSGRLEDNR